jgi:hypothetical protein
MAREVWIVWIVCLRVSPDDRKLRLTTQQLNNIDLVICRYLNVKCYIRPLPVPSTSTLTITCNHRVTWHWHSIHQNHIGLDFLLMNVRANYWGINFCFLVYVVAAAGKAGRSSLLTRKWRGPSSSHRLNRYAHTQLTPDATMSPQDVCLLLVCIIVGCALGPVLSVY